MKEQDRQLSNISLEQPKLIFNLGPQFLSGLSNKK